MIDVPEPLATVDNFDVLDETRWAVICSCSDGCTLGGGTLGSTWGGRVLFATEERADEYNIERHEM